MKLSRSIQVCRAAKIIFALAGIFYFLPVFAQQINSRYLFIFDTSETMKKRVPAVSEQIDTLLMQFNLNGQLQAGDSIGAWFFDQKLHTGELPLQRWSRENNTAITANIQAAWAKQKISDATKFSVLQPYLNGLVQNSERLTVLIFSDGDGQFIGSPYDAGINKAFQQKLAVAKKTKQPVILVLRSQLGKFTGANVSLPPNDVSLPEFPPLPLPPALATPPPAPKIQAPAPVVPPLIIIGTNVGTNLPPASVLPPIKRIIKARPIPPMVTNITNITNITNVVVVVMKTNLPPIISPVATNAVIIETTKATQPTNSSGQTNMAAAPDKMDSTSKHLAIGGMALLAVAGGLTIFLIGRARGRDRASLITQSLNKKQ